MQMPAKVPMQIEKVRRTGEVNMMDFNGVQRLAYEMEFHALVTWMEGNEDEYAELILTGKL